MRSAPLEGSPLGAAVAAVALAPDPPPPTVADLAATSDRPRAAWVKPESLPPRPAPVADSVICTGVLTATGCTAETGSMSG